jgi:hypothetical protein
MRLARAEVTVFVVAASFAVAGVLAGPKVLAPREARGAATTRSPGRAFIGTVFA